MRNPQPFLMLSENGDPAGLKRMSNCRAQPAATRNPQPLTEKGVCIYSLTNSGGCVPPQLAAVPWQSLRTKPLRNGFPRPASPSHSAPQITHWGLSST